MYKNLYTCGFVNICKMKVCGIKFSDKHNWIVEPSKSNKIYALLSTSFLTLYFFVCCFYGILQLTISNHSIYIMLDKIPITFNLRTIGRAFYFFIYDLHFRI